VYKEKYKDNFRDKYAWSILNGMLTLVGEAIDCPEDNAPLNIFIAISMMIG
jgi:hypothetical protein